jgi:hypothetical protein
MNNYAESKHESNKSSGISKLLKILDPPKIKKKSPDHF